MLGLEFLLLPLIIVGAVTAFRLGGDAGRRARRTMLMGLVCSIGGCVGALAALDAETSGVRNALSGINPYLYVFLLLAGVCFLVFGAVLAIRTRSLEKRRAEQD